MTARDSLVMTVTHNLNKNAVKFVQRSAESTIQNQSGESDSTQTQRQIAHHWTRPNRERERERCDVQQNRLRHSFISKLLRYVSQTQETY